MNQTDLQERASHESASPLLSLNDEIDLQKFLQSLFSWHREILIFTLGAVIVAGIAVLIFRLMSKPVYEAAATIAIVRVSSDITFDERFRTQSDESTIAQRTNVEARRASLLGLVKSGAIALAVIDELGDQLEGEELEPETLLDMISAAIIPGRTASIESDLIRIIATANSSEKAVLIANTWATSYVQQINKIYGQIPVEVLQAIGQEVMNAEGQYEAAQQNLESFLTSNQAKTLQRLIDEKRGIINSLQTGKQTAVDTIVSEELRARSEVITAYIQALSANRLLTFTKEQEAKRELIETYIDAEVKSRLKAIEWDRKARETFFAHLTDAQLASTIAVFDQQAQSRIDQLRQLYTQRNRLQVLIGQAKLLQQQINNSNEGGAESNALALTLLKTQMVVAPELLPSEKIFQEEQEPQQLIVEQVLPQPTPLPLTNLATPQPSTVNVPVVSVPVVNVQGDTPQPQQQVQINVEVATANVATVTNQRQDIAAMLDALNNSQQQVDQQIQTLSQTLLAGDDYYMLDQIMASELGISSNAAVSTTAVLTTTNSVTATDLASRVTQRYLDLFDVGDLATNLDTLTMNSALSAKIAELYPGLFTPGELFQLAEEVPSDNPLAVLSVTKAKELLQLQGLEDIPSYTTAAEPLIQAINQLDTEIQSLEAKLEGESARQRQLTQLRDLSWDTLKTLKTKKAELELAQSATNSEVRMAAPAVPPSKPTSKFNLLVVVPAAGLIGFVLSVFSAFVANALGKKPLLHKDSADLRTTT